MAAATMPDIEDIEDTEGDQDTHFSRCLNSLLDDVGLSKRSISKRRRSMQCKNLMHHTEPDYTGGNAKITLYVSGSTAEGVASRLDTTSDIDIMCIFPYNIINPVHGYYQLNHFAKENAVYSLEDSASHPLFKRLKYLKSGPTMKYNRNFRHINGYSYLTHDWLTSLCREIKLNFSMSNIPLSSEVCGPSAATVLEVIPSEFKFFGPTQIDFDCVVSVFCPFWPNEIDEWFVRRRYKNWPLHNDIQLVKNKGCLLVAKGFEGSAECDIEWRISFSMAENTLIQSFNNVQMKCYYLLKKFLKTQIKQKFPNVLCSYHMKTVMFWICEEIGYSLFRNECLFKCFLLCTERIRRYLEEGHFPSYFVPRANLLSGRVDRQEYKKLAEFLSIVSNKEIFIHMIANLKEYLNSNQIAAFSLHTEDSVSLICDCNPGAMYRIKQHVEVLKTKRTEVQTYFMRVISRATKNSFFCDYPKDKVFSLLKQLFFPDYAFASIAALAKTTPRNKRYYKLQDQFLTFLTDNLATEYSPGLLKRATVYYKTGKYAACMVLTMNIISMLCERNVLSLGVHQSEIMANMWTNYSLFKAGTFKYGRSVTFSPLDRPLVPDFILKEMDFDEDIDGESTYGWAFVDPLVYAYGLVIMCQHELSDFSTRDYYTQELQDVFLRRKSRICYQNSATRVIDYFREQFRRL